MYRFPKGHLLPLILLVSACSGGAGNHPERAAGEFAAGNLVAAEADVRSGLAKHPNDPALLMLGGKIAYEQADYELAKSRFSKLLAMKAPPSQARVYLAKSELLTAGGQVALDTMQGAPLDSGEAYAVVASANVMTGNGSAALALLQKGLAAYPDSPDLLAVMGEVWLALGDIGEADRSAQHALRVAPHHIDSMMLSAHVLIAQHQIEPATKVLNDVLALRPNSVPALISLAAIKHDSGDMKNAEALFTKAAGKFDGRSGFATYYLAQMAFDSGNIQKAESLLATINHDAIPGAELLTGLIAVKRNQPEQAIASLQHYLSNGHDDARARVALAAELAQTGDKAGAWNTIKPVAAAANAGPAVLRLAAQLAADDHLPEAVALQARAEAASHGDPSAQQMVDADRAMKSGDWRKADSIYSALLARNPSSSNIIVLNNAATAKLELGDTAGAERLARVAHQAAPSDPLVSDTLGWIIFRASGPVPEAVSLVKGALDAQPSNREIEQHAMMISQALRQKP